MRDVHDDFEPITESRPLVDELRGRIERDGPITFRDFMEAALYHPRYGYYRTVASAAGRGGDYVTSPQVHPVFGAMVAKQIVEIWNLMSCPAEFTLVEQGAGDALLARDVLRWAKSARRRSRATQCGTSSSSRTWACGGAERQRSMTPDSRAPSRGPMRFRTGSTASCCRMS